MRIQLKKLHVKYAVTPLEGIEKRPRGYKKNAKNVERRALARSIVGELCGLAPYEKKAVELIKQDRERRCKKFLKKRLGSLKAAQRRQEKLAEMVREE
jgi:large subunit ribosomal protein L36e